MQLTPEDIKQINKAGTSRKGDIFHILTKGGLNLIVQKSEGGEYKVLGQGPHRSFARNQAEAMEKIEWDQNLWKSEDAQGTKVESVTMDLKKDEQTPESTPQNHYDLAAHHSKMAGKAAEIEKQLPMDTSNSEKHNAQMTQLFHTDIALKHYQASGLNWKDASREHDKHKSLHHEAAPDAKAPFHDFSLQMAWQRANPSKRFPAGLGNWSE